MGDMVHVTRIDKGGGVHGHTTDHCNEIGCAGDELFWGVIPNLRKDEVYEIENGQTEWSDEDTYLVEE